MNTRDQRNRWLWGFSTGSESWNGRLAMLAFIVIFSIEYCFCLPVVELLGIFY
uniref:CAB/ELIP/HLIP superfamily protein n=1 Tax=Gracilaria vermiculophylla TaxID=2608709 RepID=A0A345U994_9FLOR|nr:hypothetical protein [Gracilaria vermiculophylla]AXI97030.1 hypothetical protein [Gracilaria vermiculophylla]QXU75231.1 hypothetical protein [Gracilaria vermiculophylla]WDZ68057.1 hypothetical protein [Gracilaria vermiculophylla]